MEWDSFGIGIMTGGALVLILKVIGDHLFKERKNRRKNIPKMVVASFKTFRRIDLDGNTWGFALIMRVGTLVIGNFYRSK